MCAGEFLAAAIMHETGAGLSFVRAPSAHDGWQLCDGSSLGSLGWSSSGKWAAVLAPDDPDMCSTKPVARIFDAEQG